MATARRCVPATGIVNGARALRFEIVRDSCEANRHVAISPTRVEKVSVVSCHQALIRQWPSEIKRQCGSTHIDILKSTNLTHRATQRIASIGVSEAVDRPIAERRRRRGLRVSAWLAVRRRAKSARLRQAAIAASPSISGTLPGGEKMALFWRGQETGAAPKAARNDRGIPAESSTRGRS